MADVSRLDGQVALVTGGAGILGRRFCQGLADAGARVAVVDLVGEAAEQAAAAIGPQAAGFACDVSDAEAVQACVDAVMAHFGRIDILINNAATKTADIKAFMAPFEEYRIETWREIMSVNIDGMFLMAQAVGKTMLAAGIRGRIVQTASIYGIVGPDHRHEPAAGRHAGLRVGGGRVALVHVAAHEARDGRARSSTSCARISARSLPESPSASCATSRP
jgi:NAD(P)-dependent dehydrogenase (short-subunit alcohol dehydrogenase family)